MNRFQTVLEAFVLAIGVNTDAADRVYRHRVRPMTIDRRPLPDASVPTTWVNVRLGPVTTPSDEGQTVYSRLDWIQDVYVDIHLNARTDDWLDAMMRIYAQVHERLQDDYTLGVAGVIQLDALGMDEPETEPADLIAAAVRTSWRVHLRTTVASLETAA